ncbi:poly(beta-D-mannuronate) lyase [Pseudomonas aeruginosa]|nr:poly(beta-D-mannuronate) lyase [Pseudomonas aeruginosa]RUB26991.1 poly(beta-D-mannuronate) lyase [Pseudomonas aeruginosa]
MRAWREAGAQAGGHAPLYPARRAGVPPGATPRPMRDRRGRAQHLRQHHGEENGGSSRLSSSAPERGKAGPT